MSGRRPGPGGSSGPSGSAVCGIVPPYLLQALAQGPDPVADQARRTLLRDAELRSARGRAAQAEQGLLPQSPRAASPSRRAAAAKPKRTIYDAKSAETLPGTRVRTEGKPATADVAVTEAYDGLGATWQLYYQAYGRNSLDGKGMRLVASVHYGSRYDNAFWNGSQMVFGDGDGEIFNRFTISVDVIGHELTHGVTEKTAGLTYQGQPGALNESMSDVFGSCVKQHLLGQDAAAADWLIGEGLFTASVTGRALRDMLHPGTAYDDSRLGKDPQPADMSGYVTTTEDSGGVHLNSGIPNRAFALAAVAIGGDSWAGAGQVWYDVLTGSRITADCDFATFAALTVDAAEARFGVGAAQASAIRSAWQTVKVLDAVTAGSSSGAGSSGAGSSGAGSSGTEASDGGGDPADTTVQLVRTGGVAGLRQETQVRLADLPEHDASAWAGLLAGPRLTQLAAVAGEQSHPDAFCYSVRCGTHDVDVDLPEPVLPQEIRGLFQRALHG